MNSVMRLLYRSGAWLPAATAAEIAAFGLQHLRSYRKLAELSLVAKEPRFPIHCKFHMIHHTMRLLELQSQKVSWLESPLTDSCQQDETFVGILARFSRRVSPKITISRTYDLYATALHQHIRDGSDES